MEALIAEVKARVLESTGLVLEEEVRRVPFRTAAPTTARRRRPLRVTRSDSKRAFRRMNEPEPNYDDAKKKTSGGDSRTGPR
jgi:hypothetical protein